MKKKPGKDHAINVRIESDIFAALEKEAEALGATVSMVVRNVLREKFKKGVGK